MALIIHLSSSPSHEPYQPRRTLQEPIDESILWEKIQQEDPLQGEHWNLDSENIGLDSDSDNQSDNDEVQETKVNHDESKDHVRINNGLITPPEDNVLRFCFDIHIQFLKNVMIRTRIIYVQSPNSMMNSLYMNSLKGNIGIHENTKVVFLCLVCNIFY